MRITPETLALDVIDAVGPGGDFLGTDHTHDHFREVWYPRLFDRRMLEGWQEAGRPTALEASASAGPRDDRHSPAGGAARPCKSACRPSSTRRTHRRA
jgi:hypothetical protein